MFGFFSKPRLPEGMEKAVVQSIKQAEIGTSAEIRVHLSHRVTGSTAMEAAQRTFKKMGMHRTELRNGVLIYVALEDRQFAIVGDSGIHECVTSAFWENLKNEMTVIFKEQDAGQAICYGVEKAGEKLKHFYPAGSTNTNELSDEISRG